MRKVLLFTLLMAGGAVLIAVKVFDWPGKDLTGRYVRSVSNEILQMQDTIEVKRIAGFDNISYAWTRRVGVQYTQKDAADKYEVFSGSAALDGKRHALLIDESEDVWVFDYKRGTLQSGANTYRLDPQD